MNNIGGRIKLIRTHYGVSQEQLAYYLGISTATLSRYENLLNTPKLPILIQISKAFDVSLEYLISGSTNNALPPK